VVSESEFPEVPQTAEEMAARWAARDAEYAKARLPMALGTVMVIRDTRMREANQLPNIKERGRMYARAKGWEPPVHQDFGSMRDWVE
jgi:hypothetical protein